MKFITWFTSIPAFNSRKTTAVRILATLLRPDSGRVRVEIHDRNVGNSGAVNIDNVLLECGDKPQCAATPGCFQRVSWSIDWTIVQQ